VGQIGRCDGITPASGLSATTFDLFNDLDGGSPMRSFSNPVLPLRAFAAAAMLLASASLAHATTTVYSASLSGPNESPVNASPGVGTSTVTYDDVAHTLHVQVTFSGLTGTTTASHIHGPTAVAGVSTAGVATTTPTFAGFPLGVTSGSYDNVLDLTLASSYNPSFVSANGGTTASAEAALIAAIVAGKAYLNVHSSTFPGGEIRGFLLAAVPTEVLTWGGIKASRR